MNDEYRQLHELLVSTSYIYFMYSKEERSRLNTLFWTSFGKYMGNRHRSVSNHKVKWVNYKTGVSHIYFRLYADHSNAIISIDIQHKDEGIRELFLEQFIQLKGVLHGKLGEEWEWQKEARTESGQSICRICTTLSGKSVYKKSDWNDIFQFFEHRMVALDSFWEEFKDIFVHLSK